MVSICQAIKGNINTLDAPALFAFARVLTRVSDMHSDALLLKQISDAASRRARELDPDEIALCVYRQSDPNVQLSGDAHNMFNSSIREAKAQLMQMSVSGLLTLMYGVTKLHPSDVGMYRDTIDNIAKAVVFKMDKSVFQDGYQIETTAVNLARIR